jgi:hypothetical protein
LERPAHKWPQADSDIHVQLYVPGRCRLATQADAGWGAAIVDLSAGTGIASPSSAARHSAGSAPTRSAPRLTRSAPAPCTPAPHRPAAPRCRPSAGRARCLRRDRAWRGVPRESLHALHRQPRWRGPKGALALPRAGGARPPRFCRPAVRHGVRGEVAAVPVAGTGP